MFGRWSGRIHRCCAVRKFRCGITKPPHGRSVQIAAQAESMRKRRREVRGFLQLSERVKWAGAAVIQSQGVFRRFPAALCRESQTSLSVHLIGRSRHQKQRRLCADSEPDWLSYSPSVFMSSGWDLTDQKTKTRETDWKERERERGQKENRGGLPVVFVTASRSLINSHQNQSRVVFISPANTQISTSYLVNGLITYHWQTDSAKMRK